MDGGTTGSKMRIWGKNIVVGREMNLEGTGRKILGIVEELKELKGRVESLLARCTGGDSEARAGKAQALAHRSVSPLLILYSLHPSSFICNLRPAPPVARPTHWNLR